MLVIPGRAFLCPLWAGLLLISVSCRKPDTVPIEVAEVAPETRVSSSAHAADPNGAAQLKEGFHAVEQNAWRWTEKRFVVVLGPPENSTGTGAVLTMRFSVPEPVISQLGPLTLSATVGGAGLPSETYTKPGDFIYTREVPGAALVGDVVPVEFSLDKALPPSEADRRELALIFSSVSLEPR